MKKICLIIPSVKAGGGAERIITELANYFSSKNNIQVHFIMLIAEKQFYSLNENIITYVPDFKHHNYKRLIFTLKIMRFLRKTIRTINPYSVLSFEEMYNSFVLLSLLFLKCRIYVSDRSQPNRNWGYIHKILKKVLYPTSTGIIAQTEIAKDIFFKQVGHKNIIVIPNPIRRINPGKEVREKIVLNVGRFVKSKRQDLLIEIFSKIRQTNWKLLLAGDGPERENLFTKCHTLGLLDKILFLGNVSDIDYYYRISRIFAFTSDSEGFPNALGEAMAASNAVISFDCMAGPSDLIIDGVNGFLVKNNNIEEYTAKLQFLIDNPLLCESFGEEAKKTSEKFSIDLIGSRYLELLAQ